MALRLGVVENEHISGKTVSGEKKKNAHGEAQMWNGKIQALNKSCDHANKENRMSQMCPRSLLSL